MAGADPLALFRRRETPPDGWERFLKEHDPRRLRHAAAGEIMPPTCEPSSITGLAIAIATPGNMPLREPRDRDTRAPESDVPQPLARAGR